MTKILTVTYYYNEKNYVITSHEDEEWCDVDIVAAYTTGSYSCDCNKSRNIQRNLDATFPTLDCGTSVELVSLMISGIEMLTR